MKALMAMLLFAASVQASSARAEAATPSPLWGQWAVDVSRLPMPPQARPKSVTLTFSDAGPGKLTTQVDIVDAGGAKTHSVGTNPLDGTPVPVKDNIEADSAAMSMPAPNVLVMALGRNGGPASTRIFTVAKDGKSMVEMSAFTGDNGLPAMRTHYFTRVK
ncbi:hypothetical protein SAMN04487785_1033 [Dyella jiangningensis]|uniref:hypothetical protein n=1 Tax=Dyella sp. AtDHG13 TaxID=1938897 RepID=UPI00088A9707|nr:hypothetical protein [Dyella sp. AtDHG13]PXV61833.1 hypothetical protein BDW41_101580 [Dyella sp. AtDHG13]SDJ62336.1 hypothetical protein SAMN04487785_1033 [Dyella jiangningensis]